LPKSFFESHPIPLPPLAEQHRIVAKVEELMALCDELEKQETHHLTSHALLVETLLGTLTQAKDAKEFQQAWSLLAQHFDDLFTTENSIDQLKQTILQLAVMGRLVPQDASDEPAAKLLDRIRKEKELKIDREKPLPEVDEDEVPKLPKGWAAERFGNIFNVINGRAYKMHEMLQAGVPILRVGNLFTSDEWYYSDLELEPEKYIDKGDLIYAWSASFGPFIWAGDKVIYHYHIWKLDPYSALSIDKRYFLHYLNAITKSIKDAGSGIAMIHMTKDKMQKLVVSLPPLTEQVRIAEKLDLLFALCDGLKARLAAAQSLAGQMAEGVVEG
jgi:type I restriction enzyme S subunit